MKYAGMAFIAISAASVGMQMSASLGKRCRLLQQFLAVLQILRNEISVCGTPLPQAFALMAVSSGGAVAQLFSSVAREMDSRRWLSPAAAIEHGLECEQTLLQDQVLCEIIRRLGSGLGKYDRESQLQTIDFTASELSALLNQTKQEHSVRGKTYRTLGICAGLAMVILLA